MAVPAQRFQPPTAPTAPVPAVQARQPLTVGPTEITRRVSASGLIGVCYQQVSAGRHLTGQVVTVRLHPSIMQVFFAGQRSAPCHAAAPRRWSRSAPTDPPAETTHDHLGNCQPSPGTKPESTNRNWTTLRAAER
jgi:hypothetical protein